MSSPNCGYRAIPRAEPKNFDATHLVGAVLSVKGFSPVAEAMLRLALDPKVAPVRNNPGDVVNAQGKLEDCSPVTAAMELDPKHADAFDNHGNIWSWTLNGDDSPLYSAARLFRQTTVGGRDGVFARTKKRLAAQLRSSRN